MDAEIFADPELEKYHGKERTEEVRDIIDRMPTKFGFWVTGIVVFIFLLLILFGWVIRYPDIVKGQLTVNTALSPIKLVANTSGKIQLNNINSGSLVNGGTAVAYIESATSFETLQAIKNILKDFNPTDFQNTSILSKLPSKVALGELTSRYYVFLNNLHLIHNFNTHKLYDKQISSLQELHESQTKEIYNSSERININQKTEEYLHKFFRRDSLLFKDKVASEADLDKSKLDYLVGEAGSSNARSSQVEAEKQAKQTLGKITEVAVQKSEKRKELEIAFLASYNDLIDYITLWEQKYLFIPPFKGKLQFQQFWTNDQFIEAGQTVFTVIPEIDEPYGQVLLPALGAGKVETGQEVIIKLDDFPYSEYGTIKGTVSNISLTSNTEKTSQGNIDVYLVTIKYENGLTTNYKKKLDVKHQSKGSAEIITNDRRLIQRLFDNLKYILEK
jgi:hypothetical protein